jgi:excinuclease ABC subunit C
LKRFLADRDVDQSEVKESGGRLGKFSYPPQLIVVDGGAPQVAAGARALQELGITDIALCGLAKRLEEVWLPHNHDPLILPRTSEGMYLLQRIRDEAHRFAISFHRELRGKRMTTSVLDDIVGLGEVRRKRLVRELGGVGAVKKASLEELAALAWLPDSVAQAVYDKIHSPAKGRTTD